MNKVSLFFGLAVLLFSASALTVDAYGGIGGGPIIGDDGECNGLSGSINCVINIVRGGGGGGACMNCKNDEQTPAPEVTEEVVEEEGEVLGATCVPLLKTYMREGQTNPTDEVTKLQLFLNGNLGKLLPVTGVFDRATTEFVNAFQRKYWQDVLVPWVPFGLGTPQTPTGYVYKTTLWKVNQLACPDIAPAVPALP